MAYQQNVITAMSDIMPLVYAFANTNGFTVTGTTSAPVVAINGTGFLLSTTTAGFNTDLLWTAQSSVLITSTARIRSPKLNGSSATPEVQLPSKVHLFGDGTFLAIVVEYQYNLYRHLYLGQMEQQGTYSGGQVLSGTNFYSSATALDYPIHYRDERRTQYLFGAHQNGWAASDAGGVLVDQANNPTKFRTFRGPDSAAPGADLFTGSEVFGGFRDDVNDGYLARGLSSYAGVNILVPIELYCPVGVGTAARFSPIGHPKGVRMVNMTGLDPNTTLTIGSTDWLCFPAFSKNGDTVAAPAGGAWGAGETSGVVGYAYRKG